MVFTIFISVRSVFLWWKKIKDQTKTPIKDLLSGPNLQTLLKSSIFFLGKKEGIMIQRDREEGLLDCPRRALHSGGGVLCCYPKRPPFR